jgi:hypothetical protein
MMQTLQILMKMKQMNLWRCQQPKRKLAASLHEYALAQPQIFAAADVSALQCMQEALAQSIAQSIASGKK